MPIFDIRPMALMWAKNAENGSLVTLGDPFRFIAYNSPFFYRGNWKGSPRVTKISHLAGANDGKS